MGFLVLTNKLVELDAFTHMTVIAGRLGGLGGTNGARQAILILLERSYF